MARYTEDDVREARGLPNGQDFWGERQPNRGFPIAFRGVVPPGSRTAAEEADRQLGDTQPIERCPRCGRLETNRDLMRGHACPGGAP